MVRATGSSSADAQERVTLPGRWGLDDEVRATLRLTRLPTATSKTDDVDHASYDLRSFDNGALMAAYPPSAYNASSGGGYNEQPQIEINADGSWTAVLTTGCDPEPTCDFPDCAESAAWQHVAALTSSGSGSTWSNPSGSSDPRTWVSMEPPGSPEDGRQSSWAQLARSPSSGKLFAFYNINLDNPTRFPNGSLLPAVHGQRPCRMGCDADSIAGRYVFKSSSSFGRTWSARTEVSIRNTSIDRENAMGGTIREGWGVGHPVVTPNGTLLVQYTKLSSNWGGGVSETFYLRSDDLLSAEDPASASWMTLPRGERGLWSSTVDKHNGIEGDAVVYGPRDESLYVLIRTASGVLEAFTSQNLGFTWSEATTAMFLRPRADGTAAALKNPSGPLAVKRVEDANGKRRYLLLFYNKASEADCIQTHGNCAEARRNPYWLAGGLESSGTILWSQPELAVYADTIAHPSHAHGGLGYPDIVAARNGSTQRYYIASGDKHVLRLNTLDTMLVEDLWRQATLRDLVPGALIEHTSFTRPTNFSLGASLPDLTSGGGFSLELSFTLAELSGPRTLVRHAIALNDTHTAGLTIGVSATGAVTVAFADTRGHTQEWASPGGPVWTAGVTRQVVLIVDGGPKVLSLVVDGVLWDGGSHSKAGWGVFEYSLGQVTSATASWCAMPAGGAKGLLHKLRVYPRALRVSEAISNYQHDILFPSLKLDDPQARASAVAGSENRFFGTAKPQQLVLKDTENELFSYDVQGTRGGTITSWWITSPPGNPYLNLTRMRFYVDGEENAAIDFKLYAALGEGFGEGSDTMNDDSQPGYKMPWGNRRIGSAAHNSVYSTIRIPFGSRIRVTATLPPGVGVVAPFCTSGCEAYWFWIHGLEALPVQIGDSLVLPSNARLRVVQKEETYEPLEMVSFVRSEASHGAVYLASFLFDAPNLNFLEGCFRGFLGPNRTRILLSSGSEEFFLSSWYFCNGQCIYSLPGAGMTHSELVNGTVRLSAFRLFEEDPVVFQDGFELKWRNGDSKSSAPFCSNLLRLFVDRSCLQ